MVRIYLICGVWEVDEVVPITCLLPTFGGYFYVCLNCYAMLVDVDWVSVTMTDVRLLMVYLRWQLKNTSGWIEVPGYSRIACFLLDRHPGSKGS